MDTDLIKLILIDDHSLFRNGVKASLQAHKDVKIIGEAENGVQLLKLLKELSPDVILLDISMPVMDGIVTLQNVKELYPSIKVIILTMHNDSTMINRMMELGANSYLTKEIGAESIYETVVGVYKNDFHFNELTNKALLGGLRNKSFADAHRISEIKLNQKEIQILKLMCEEKSTKEISDIVELSPRTIEAIRDNLKIKTGTKSMAGLIMYAVKSGIVDQ